MQSEDIDDSIDANRAMLSAAMKREREVSGDGVLELALPRKPAAVRKRRLFFFIRIAAP